MVSSDADSAADGERMTAGSTKKVAKNTSYMLRLTLFAWPSLPFNKERRTR